MVNENSVEGLSVSSASAPPLLEVQNLRKSFGNVEVIKGVSFNVAEGETIGLIGSSGSGKTTILRCLNFITMPSSGLILLSGERLGFETVRGTDRILPERKLAAQRRRLGFVFQRFNLFPHLTALQNVAMGPQRVLGLSRREAQERAAEDLERVFLKDHMHKRPSQLSGGQQQRVAIARALSMRPSIILFDEPTSSLDPELVNEVLSVMHLLAANGMTMIVVTHELGFVRKIADRVIFMHGGVVKEEQAAEQFFQNPQQPETIQFLQHLSKQEARSDPANYLQAL